MSPEMIELLRRIQGLERQINARPASIERANSPMIDRFGGTVGNLTGVVRWNGSSPSWTQSVAGDIDDQSRIGYAVMVNSGKPTVYLQGSLWIDHAFAAGLPLYCDPSSAGQLTATKPTADGDSTRIIAYAGAGGWIWLANTGEAQAKALTSLDDVDINPEELAEDDVISWDATAGKWVINTVGEIGLGERLATSVIGRSANSAGAAADIQATGNDRYFGRKADALGFFQVAWADLNLTGAALPVGGDLDDTTDNATVVGIQGVPVDSTTPVAQDTWAYSTVASAWVPSQLLQTGKIGSLLSRRKSDGLMYTLETGTGNEGKVLTNNGLGEDLTWESVASLIGAPPDAGTRTVYTSGSGTHTFTKKYFLAVVFGGGGAGGRSDHGGGYTSIPQGGGSGEELVLFGTAPASGSYTVGAGGTGSTGLGASGAASSFLGIPADGGEGGGAQTGFANDGTAGFSGSGASAADRYAQVIDGVMALRIPGESGAYAPIIAIDFTGSFYSFSRGMGGHSNRRPGYGGYGAPSGSSESGNNGLILIIEWD